MTDPSALVLILGGEADWGTYVQLARHLSHNLTLLLAPGQIGAEVQPSTAQVTEAVAALAEDPAAVKVLLASGLGEHWWEKTPQLNQALRLAGSVLTLYETPLAVPCTPDTEGPACAAQAEAVAAIRRAKLVLLGPGNPRVNLLPVLTTPGLRSALKESQGDYLWLDGETQPEKLEAWFDRTPQLASPATWQEQAHKLLLAQAANRAKTIA